MGVRHTCGWAGKIELAPIRVELNGSRPVRQQSATGEVASIPLTDAIARPWWHNGMPWHRKK